MPEAKRVSARGIEVGHIFFFGTKYSEPMGCRVQGPDGSMIDRADGVLRRGCVAPGCAPSSRPAMTTPASSGRCRWRRSRLASSTSRPATRIRTRPARLSMASCSRPASRCSTTTPDERAGAKFATMDLIGLPFQLIVGPQGAEERRGRGEGPQDRRAGDHLAGGGPETTGRADRRTAHAGLTGPRRVATTTGEVAQRNVCASR